MEKTIVKFWGKGCMNCKAFSPVFDALASEYKDISFKSVDIGTDEDVAKKYEVTSLPTLVFLKGETIVGKLVGLKPKSLIIKKIQEVF